MKKSRLLAIFLAAMTLLCACSQDSGNDTLAVDDTSSDTEIAEDSGPALGLPEDLDFSGEKFRLITAESILVGSNEEDANVIGRAIYRQFSNTSERLGVEFEYHVANPFDLAQTWVTTSVNSDSDDYDAVFTIDGHQNAMIQAGYYLPVNELTYVDLDNIWWNKGYIQSVSLNPSEPYLLFGDITYNAIERLSCVFFNKRLMNQLHGLADTDIYQTVLDGKWTIDKFVELASDVYEDNGNTQQDHEDLHGLTANGYGSFEFLVYSSGLQFTSRDEDGFPVLNMNNDNSVTIADKLLYLINSDSYYDTKGKNGTNDYLSKFAEGNSLFIANRFFSANWMRDMTDDYGIIPMPKFDESIDGYYSTVSAFVQWGAVPVTCSNTDMVSAALESLAYEGYQHVTPAYYETTLKLKYTRGDVDIESQMLDIITQGMRTDFLYANRLGGVGNIYKEMYNTRQNNFSSLYASYEVTANKTLSDMIDEALNK